jgi:hypothetical protein
MQIPLNKEDLYYKIFESCPHLVLLAHNDPIEIAANRAFEHFQEGWSSVEKAFHNALKCEPNSPCPTYSHKPALEYLKNLFKENFPETVFPELPAPFPEKETQPTHQEGFKIPSTDTPENTNSRISSWLKQTSDDLSKKDSKDLIIGVVTIALLTAYVIYYFKTSQNSENNISQTPSRVTPRNVSSQQNYTSKKTKNAFNRLKKQNT